MGIAKSQLFKFREFFLFDTFVLHFLNASDKCVKILLGIKLFSCNFSVIVQIKIIESESPLFEHPGYPLHPHDLGCLSIIFGLNSPLLEGQKVFGFCLGLRF